MNGRVGYVRFRVDGASPGSFGPEHLEKLSSLAIGKQREERKDGTEVGWIAGDDILDLGFDLAKNVIEDCLLFSLRLDTRKLPADLLRAYAREELQVLAGENPSGRPSAKQKKEAREAAQQRLEAEAKDGRFTRRKAYPLLWDGRSNHLLIGTTSASVLDHAQRLFAETFGHSLEQADAGRRALLGVQGEVDLRPSGFVASGSPSEVAWATDAANPVHLGNEFLLWLWFVLECEGDTLPLGDGSEVVVMMAKTLLLECPKGVSGSETIRSAGPAKLPEARRAIQAGKLPRQVGLILVRHSMQYELTLQAETLAVSAAKLPPAEEKDRAALEERIGQIRHLGETVDLLYAAFTKRRLDSGWPADLGRIQHWLQREDGSRTAEAA